MKKIWILSVATLITLSFSNCKKSNNGPSTTASVMFVNGAAGTTTLTGEANTASVSNAASVSFLGNSGYQNVTQGSETLSFVIPGINTTLASGTETLTAGAHYSAFAGGLSTNGKFVFTTDDLTAPASGMAKLRVVNLSPDALSLTTYVDNAAVDSGVSSASYSQFFSVAAGSHKLTVGDGSAIISLVVLNSQQLSAGKIYTLIYTGTGTGTGTAGYTITLIGNN